MDPARSIEIVYAPSVWTPQHASMATGDVDQYFNTLSAKRAQEHRGFE